MHHSQLARHRAPGRLSPRDDARVPRLGRVTRPQFRTLSRKFNAISTPLCRPLPVSRRAAAAPGQDPGPRGGIDEWSPTLSRYSCVGSGRQCARSAPPHPGDVSILPPPTLFPPRRSAPTGPSWCRWRSCSDTCTSCRREVRIASRACVGLWRAAAAVAFSRQGRRLDPPPLLTPRDADAVAAARPLAVRTMFGKAPSKRVRMWVPLATRRGLLMLLEYHRWVERWASPSTHRRRRVTA